MVDINRIQLTANFNLIEFECRCCGQVKLDPQLLAGLQTLRDKLGQPVVLTSAYRCPQHNAAIGGAERSQHMLGKAADISLRNMPLSIAELVKLAEEIGFRGIGLYRSPMLHVDTRETPARWDWR